MRNTLDLTEGNIWKKILLFALPLLGSSFIQQLYNTVDLLFIGNLVGKEAQAAVGASSLLITCIVGFFTGLSVGCGVITSQARGAGDRKKMNLIIHTSLGISLLGGTVLMIVGISMAQLFLKWINTPEEILGPATIYARIYFLSMIPLCIYNIYAGVIRAQGDSATPMRIQLIGGITNVVMDYALIHLVPNGIYGVAFATLFSQSIAAFLSLRYMHRGNEWSSLRFHNICLDRTVINSIFQLGVPAGLQSLVITLSNVFVQAFINRLGVDAIAGYATYFKVELLNYLPIVALGSAMMTFSGQCFGANKEKRISEGVRVCIIIGVIYVGVMSALLYYFGEYAFKLFTQDTGVVESGMRIIHVTVPFYWLYVILQVLSDAVRGKGKTLPPMIIILSTICVFRTVCLFIFTHSGVTIERVAATYPSAWAAAVICLVIYWSKDLRKNSTKEVLYIEDI